MLLLLLLLLIVVVVVVGVVVDGCCWWLLLFVVFEGYFDESGLEYRLLCDVFYVEYCAFFVFMFESFEMGSVVGLVSSFDLRMKLFFADRLHFCGFGASHEGI